MPDFLLEIGTEEIPDWMIEDALSALQQNFETLLTTQALDGFVHDAQATPRRLVLQAQQLRERQADREEIVNGPPVSAGAGAAQGFARKMNTTVEQLDTVETGKGKYLSFRKQVAGQHASEILSEALPSLITSIPFPKTMYWIGRVGPRFIRPIRWIVALLDDQVVPFELAGVRAANTTFGHRILGSKQPLPVTLKTYEQVLRANGVILRASERQQRIEAGLTERTQPDAALLKSLVYLTEFPTPIRGTFDRSYLELPAEILSTVMRHHQRYFSVRNEDGTLAPEFIAVTNTDGDPDGLIRLGNERVLRARFNDARFFWAADQEKKLADRIDDLAKVTFHVKLGSYQEKAERMASLAVRLADLVGADADTMRHAALLAKCDLTTTMVDEFTELQGVVGGLYAKEQGEPTAVADAIYDHYKPLSMDDSVPRTTEAQLLALADKIDTLRQCFRIGLVPTGSKDPLALRRAAQGVIKILFESRLAIPPMEIVEEQPELIDFIDDRIIFYLRDVKGYPYDEVNAAMAAPSPWLGDLADRLEALHQVRSTPDFEPLAASFKRIKNILHQADWKGEAEIDPGKLTAGPEQDLYQAFIRVRAEMQNSANYEAKLAKIASLRSQVDFFFDKILVNDPDPVIRQNRLALLGGLIHEFSTIADFSEIVARGASAQD